MKKPNYDWRDITSVEKVVEVRNIGPKVLDVFDLLPEEHRWPKDLFILTEAIAAVNQGWEADFLNPNQPKWFLWPWVKKDPSHPSGLGLSCHAYDYSYTNARVGARLSLETEPKLRHIYDHFEENYKRFYFKYKK